MKIMKIYFLLFAFILTAVCYGQSPEEMMNNANTLYQKNDFAGAQKIYKELLDNGYTSAPLYYNLGNAHYRMGDLGYAVYYFEKALKLAPGDEDIIHNIKIASAKTIDKINEVPKIFITRWWDALVVSLSASGWSFVLLLVFGLFLFYLAVYLLTKRDSMRKMSFLSGSGVLAALIIVVFIWLARINIETSDNYGILLDKNANVKVSPDYQSNDAFVLHEGTKFSLEERMNGWYKVKLADGKLGWLPQNSVGKI